eukprot:CAMPEP_0198121534 /NCGR_PEP_ID=MMETSP1442-20131203/32406_1 /TAXON_ID= /ORGANISM="Craspedostauros australis, Strain CCMP3328" /LENGTH=75 /DNA_ID=CAMNT_0043780369 /DNA_START=351 /DNA_END=575 /DNA_ORIENTATION=-
MPAFSARYRPTATGSFDSDNDNEEVINVNSHTKRVAKLRSTNRGGSVRVIGGSSTNVHGSDETTTTSTASGADAG